MEMNGKAVSSRDTPDGCRQKEQHALPDREGWPGELFDGELARVWDLTGAAPAHLRGFSEPPKAELLIHAAMADAAAAKVARKAQRLRWTRWSIAAAALLVLTLGIGRFWIGQRPSTRAAAADFRTGAGELATVRLDDGSMVGLAPDSRLYFTGRPDARELDLEGRAFFDVEPQDQGEFIVRTALGQAHVLGTRFEVRASEDSLRVLVVDGRVAVSVGEHHVDVGSGEMMLATSSTTPTVVPAEDLDSLLGWIDGWLVFQEMPLEQVAAEIQRHYGVRVQVVEQKLAQRTVTAWFTGQALDDVITVVCRVVQATCVVEDSSVVISP